MDQVNEAGLSRTYEHMQNHDVAIMTAFRDRYDCGKGEELTRKENKQRNKSLQLKARAKGYGVTKAKGAWYENAGTENAKEVKEESFIIVNLKDDPGFEKTIKGFGLEFEQDAVIVIEKGGQKTKLIGTNRCEGSYPGFNKVQNLKGAVFGKDGEFFTRVNGRPFIIKEGEEVYESQGHAGKFAVYLGAKTPWEELEVEDV